MSASRKSSSVSFPEKRAFPSASQGLCKPTTELCKSGQSRERRVKSSPDLSNLCSILIKISLPLPHRPPSSTPQLRHVSLCYELASCLGHRSAPRESASPPLWAHVADTFIPLLGQGWTQSRSVLATTTTSSSSLNYLRPDQILPSHISQRPKAW